ncbi:MAG: hypothetical protein KF852_11380 [Saprospiraceae bacterium]|nr:hypothetical protein [Saprospiraceae bacterium]
MENTSMNRAQFRTFLLLYAANADLQTEESEMQYIREVARCDNFDEVQTLFAGCADYECLQLIMGYRDQYFATPEAQTALLAEVAELFGKDGEYSLLEVNTMKMLKKLIH